MITQWNLFVYYNMVCSDTTWVPELMKGLHSLYFTTTTLFIVDKEHSHWAEGSNVQLWGTVAHRNIHFHSAS